MRDAGMTAGDARHTLAMLDAGTFETAAARQRLSAPGRAAHPRPRRRCDRGRRHPPRGLRCDGVVPGLRQAPCAQMAWDSVEPGARRPHRRFLSPNDYRIPRPARKLLAHLDAGPWSPATSNAAQELATPGRG